MTQLKQLNHVLKTETLRDKQMFIRSSPSFEVQNLSEMPYWVYFTAR
jgi:hypothetical protein